MIYMNNQKKQLQGRTCVAPYESTCSRSLDTRVKLIKINAINYDPMGIAKYTHAFQNNELE